jgi:hypothetical protein
VVVVKMLIWRGKCISSSLGVRVVNNGLLRMYSSNKMGVICCCRAVLHVSEVERPERTCGRVVDSTVLVMKGIDLCSKNTKFSFRN